jgi:beta-lactamase regulating signal transducer with metallopeptidase domain
MATLALQTSRAPDRVQPHDSLTAATYESWNVPWADRLAAKIPAAQRRSADVLSSSTSLRATLVPDSLWVATAKQLAWVWLIGCPLSGAWMLLGLLGLRRWSWRRTHESAPPWLSAQCDRLREQLAVRRPVQVHLVDRFPTPLLVGVLRPRILLPRCLAQQWSENELKMVLLHELAHVRRFDNLALFVQRGLECIFFFHPCVWQLSRWLHQDREECCDRWVVRKTGQRDRYAEVLWSLASRRHRLRQFSLGMATGSLRHRVEQILSQEVKMSGSRKLVTLLTVSLTGLLVSAAVPFAAQQCPAPPAPNLAVVAYPDPARTPDTAQDFAPQPAVHADCTACHTTPPSRLATPHRLARIQPVPAQASACSSCHVTDPKVHVVRAGDSLSRIAVRYFGDSQQWARILQENPLVACPQMLKVGQRLTIPEVQPAACCSSLDAVRKKAEELQEALQKVNLHNSSADDRQQLEEVLRKALEQLQQAG